jgi:uncharacterized membrane protein YqjE
VHNELHHEKPLGTVISETKAEVKEFIQTRVAMLQAETKEKLRTWKYTVPLLLGAAALLLAAWMILSFALVALIHSWLMPTGFGWFWAALIVGGAYLIGAIIVGWFAYSETRAAGGVAPTRTLKVLKQDQVWIQNEARTA